jgi:four helix bundle protein
MNIRILSIGIVDDLLKIDDDLESEHLFRFGEQLKGAAMSISNNIPKGSGSDSKRNLIIF